MRKIFRLSILLLAFVTVLSCKEKKDDNLIIIRKPAAAKQTKPHRMADNTLKKTVSWVGAEYTVTISQKADTSLPLASDGTLKYYDNRIDVKISRSDGSQFFERSFTKSSFKQYVDEQYYDDGALIGIVFDKVDGKSLKFAVSVGNPDKSSDEYVPLNLAINNFGTVSISKSTEMDNE